MPDTRNIVLVGFMGTGKTAVGKALAARLGLTFVDMDAVIEQRAGKPITRLFAEDGEPAFRAMERQLVQELAGQHGLVIAAGGGIVLNPDNIRDFSGSGLVVCLQAAPETILRRVASETHRPLLPQRDKLERIRALLKARRPLYEAIPCRMDTTGFGVDEVADRIAALYAGGT
jgi:shikimate kinase